MNEAHEAVLGRAACVLFHGFKYICVACMNGPQVC